MAKTPAERMRDYRASRGAKTRTGLEPCGTLAAARRHERAGLKLAEMDAACQDALRAHQREQQARYRARKRG